MPRTSFIPGAVWPDDQGNPINAHGGGVLYHQDRYYWHGEHKIVGKAGNSAQVGVHCYSSSDLYNWHDEGIALPVSTDSSSEITVGCIIERPKVVWNRLTDKFVMWFHLEWKDQGYAAARVGVATADRPTGPFTFHFSFRPNAGDWPLDMHAQARSALYDSDLMERMNAFTGGGAADTLDYPLWIRDFATGQMSRDMTLFIDEDGTAYHIRSAEENRTLHVAGLSEDYLWTNGTYVRAFPNRWHEAPALCKAAGRYWMITSGCTGWAPNAARSAVADQVYGPWTELGNPAEGVNPMNGLGPEKTFGAQSTFLLPVAGLQDAVIALFDIWCPDNPVEGTYAWLPVRFTDDRIIVTWHDEWDLSLCHHP